MAGRRDRAMVVQWLESRARAELEEGATVLDYVCHWLADGNTLVSLTKEASAELNTRVRSSLISDYVRSKYGEDGEQRVALARARGSFAQVEDAQEIIDDAAPNRDELQKAKMQADMRIWMAERFNRKQFGAPNAAANVTVNVAMMHLDALRKRDASAASPVPAIHGVAEVAPEPTASRQLAAGDIEDVIVESVEPASVDAATT